MYSKEEDSMITKTQAYKVSLDSLNNVWDTISDSADMWRESPKLTLKQVTTPVQKSAATSAKEIRAIEKQLAPAETVAQSIMDVIAARLEAFSGILAMKDASILSAEELIKVWRRSLVKILKDVAEQAPEIKKIGAYIALNDRLAA